MGRPPASLDIENLLSSLREREATASIIGFDWQRWLEDEAMDRR